MSRFLSILSPVVESTYEEEDKFSPLPARLNKKRGTIFPQGTFVWPAPFILSPRAPRVCSFDMYEDNDFLANLYKEERNTMDNTTTSENINYCQPTLKRQEVSYPLEQKRQFESLPIMFCEESDFEPITFTGETDHIYDDNEDPFEYELDPFEYQLDEDTSYTSLPSLISDRTFSIDSASVYSNSDEGVLSDDETPIAAFPLSWDHLETTSVGKIQEQQWPGTPLLAAAKAFEISLPHPVRVSASTPIPAVPAVRKSLECSAPLEYSSTRAYSSPPTSYSCRKCLHLAHKRNQAHNDTEMLFKCCRCATTSTPVIASILDTALIPVITSTSASTSTIRPKIASKSTLKSKFSRFLFKSKSKIPHISLPIQPMEIIHLGAPSASSSSNEDYSFGQPAYFEHYPSTTPLPNSRFQLHQTHLRIREERRNEAVRLAQGVAELRTFVRQESAPQQYYSIYSEGQFTSYGEEMTLI